MHLCRPCSWTNENVQKHRYYVKILYEGNTLLKFIYEKSISGPSGVITLGLSIEPVLEVCSIDSISMNLEKRVEGWNVCITKILGIPWGFLIGPDLFTGSIFLNL
ncbi:hypothetical protein Patl1_06891 [Pistacia atlantica]|uniref:Uncharacterized protein n=1 Tax=Pistacia atlantica TaxID=434234 RepID=A0ACC1AIU7_9ROSI|nr:hypothetical protein Patl1_06891 [Pistacia atlantica]